MFFVDTMAKVVGGGGVGVGDAQGLGRGLGGILGWVQLVGRLLLGEKKSQIMGNILERVFFPLITKLSLSTFPTGGDTVREECVFSRYMLISII